MNPQKISMTHIIGRGIWSETLVDLLTVIFVIAGALAVQVGLIRIRNRMNRQRKNSELNLLESRLLLTGVYCLQAALISIIVIVVVQAT